MDRSALIKNLAVPASPIDVVLDTDCYNEIDDQYALSYMLRNSGRINLKEIYAAPFFNPRSTGPADGMEKSYNEILKVLDLAGCYEMEAHVYRGSEKYMESETAPVDSPAARALVSLASNYTSEKPLYVVAIGAITNVASALVMEPSICDKIVLVWLGGTAFHRQDVEEFNMMQDYNAARVVFNCGAPVVMLPCAGVVDQFRTTEPELKYWLSGKNSLCNYLVENTSEEANSYAAGKPWSRVIWDVTAAAWLLNDGDRFMKARIEPSPIVLDGGKYELDETRHPILYVYEINRDALFEDLFNSLAK